MIANGLNFRFAKHFTNIITSDPYNNPVVGALRIPILHMRKVR